MNGLVLSTFTSASTIPTPFRLFVRLTTICAGKFRTSHWLLKTVSTFFRTSHKSSDRICDIWRSNRLTRKSYGRSNLRNRERNGLIGRSREKDSRRRNRRRSRRTTKMVRI